MRLPSSALLVLCLLGAPVAAAELSARLERQRITEDETVTLLLSASGEFEGRPDFGPLRTDFELVDQARTSRMRFSGGVSSRFEEWRLELAPRRTGWLVVPSLQIGDSSSEPLTLEVVAADPASGGADPRVAIEVAATPLDPYVQGHVEYRVRVLADAELQEWQLTVPTTDEAVFRRLGDDRWLTETVEGAERQVIERRYAVFPLSAGTLAIAAPQLTAAIPVPVQVPEAAEDGFGADPFGPLDPAAGAATGQGESFQASRQVRARGEALSLDVRPPPSGAPEPWLPAESLALTEEWEANPRDARVGAPIRRKVTLTAVGARSAQLPELELAAPLGVDLETAPAEMHDRFDGERPRAVKEVTATYVPARAGEFPLPELRLSWWDTGSDRPRDATLPPRVLHATRAAAPGGSAAGNRDPAPNPVTRLAEALSDLRGGGGLWPPLAAGLALGWLLTLLLWWRARRRVPARRARQGAIAKARRRIETAFRSGAAQASRDAVLAWAALIWPGDPPRGLLALAARMDSSAAAAALTGLDRNLYAEPPVAWDGRAAWTALRPALHERGGVSRRPPRRRGPDQGSDGRQPAH